MKTLLIKEQLNNVSTDDTTYILNKYTTKCLKVVNSLTYTDWYIFSKADNTFPFSKKEYPFQFI